MPRMPFEVACAHYPNRFTMEHVPAWAAQTCNGKHYAPQYANDREWFDNTLFPPHNPLGKRCTDCYSSNQTWPLGFWLSAPYRRTAS